MNHPIPESPYRLHRFQKREFLPLKNCCAKASFLYPTNLYITAYDPFQNRENDFTVYSCSKCGAMYIRAQGGYRCMENLLKFDVKLRK